MRPQQRPGGIGWLVQVSDIHISKFIDNPVAPDLLSFSRHVIRHLRPDKLLITGDLVDGKTRHESSMQFEEEWVAYQALWQDVAAVAGLPHSAILDIRGNHDTFDTIRGGFADYYATYSTRAAAGRCGGLAGGGGGQCAPVVGAGGLRGWVGGEQSLAVVRPLSPAVVVPKGEGRLQ